MMSFKNIRKKPPIEEDAPAPTMSTANVPGTGDDSSLVIVRKKKDLKPITRRYIEIAGKRKKIEKK